MAKGAMVHESPYNEVNNKNPETPDTMGKGLYFDGYDEPLEMTLTSYNIFETPNSKASRDLYGGPAPKEPNPAGMKGK